MIAVCRILSIALAFLVSVSPTVASGKSGRPSARLPGLEAMKQQAMIFFVAKGEPGSCGQGCSEWIAAEGAFDPQAHERLREFLALQARKDRPIFFHSTGGMVGSSILIGGLLRERRMTAGVGQTLPEGCREAPKADEACRKLMRSGRELKARLRFNGAICASSCAYAFFGASMRNVALGARLGVHSSRVIAIPGQAQASSRAPKDRDSAQTKMNAGYDWLKRYALQMGIDSGVIDLARGTGPDRMRWLSRDELHRFGVLANDVFETRWQSFDASGAGTAIIKSITERLPNADHGPLTTTIELGCAASGYVSFSVRRELPSDGEASAFRVTSNADLILDDNERTWSIKKLNHRAKFLAGEVVRRAASSEAIVLQETTGTNRREIKFSTKGLAETLTAARGGCAGKT